MTNDRARDVLLLHHPFLRRDRIAVIAQGYDEQSNHDDSLPHNAGPFTLVYTGNLYAGVQSSLEFLQALRLLASDGITVQILWAGSGLPTDEAERLNRVGASPVIQDLGRLPHHDALALQRKAAMLLVLGTRRSTNIPGKTIEYIGARRPILCLSEGPHDLAAKFVREHGLGVVVPNRTSDIVAALRDLHALWLKGQLDTIYHPADIERFSWRSLARDLEGILLEVIAQNAAQAVASTRDGGDGSVDYMAQARDE